MTNRKIIIFHEIFIFLHGYLAYYRTYHHEIVIHVAEVCLEGSVSQNFDIGPNFYFILYSSWNFGKNDKNNKGFSFFVINSKPGPQ